MKKILFSLPFFITLVYIAACDNTESFNSSAKSTADEHLLHSVSGEKLRVIMQNLHSSLYKDGREPMSMEKIPEDQMADIIEAAEELLFHAELLSMGKPEVELDDNELVTFRAMASQLYTETLNLKQLTEFYDFHIIEPAYDRLQQTCIACHSLFRKKNQ